MKLGQIISVFILLCFGLFTNTYAFSNNKFGIHITHSEDLNRASELVNSNGGDWGYVTAVIQENDRNYDKWQNFFDLSREKHLIPLVRIAAEPQGSIWLNPKKENLSSWVEFLDSLNWPIKNRYVIIYNEPNHAKEWGGEIKPKEYSQILNLAITLFKEKNPDFMILNAGLDQAAPNSRFTMNEYSYLREMNFEVPGIFNRLDGWATHSYPNHGFIGKPWETGKASVKGYEWELSVLKKEFGLTKELPVYITETGWPHTQNKRLKIKDKKYYSPEITSEYIRYAFEKIWLPDKKVKVVTPFILNYPAAPFDNFSWLDKNGDPYPQFDQIRRLTKEQGEPEQIQKIEVTGISYPSFIPANNVFKGKITLKNIGQSIWGEKIFKLISENKNLKISDLELPPGVLIKPGEKYSFEFEFTTPGKGGEYEFSWENLPTYKTVVFEVWNLTNKKETIFNRLIGKITNFWYNLRN